MSSLWEREGTHRGHVPEGVADELREGGPEPYEVMLRGVSGALTTDRALLGASEEANVTGKLRELCVLAGSSWPYKSASRVLESLCGAQVSPESIRQITIEAGAEEAHRQAEVARQVHKTRR